VFYFENDGDPEVYGASADWMDRNLFRRVETAFPFEDKKIKARVIEELNTYLNDNTQAWELHNNGEYTLISNGQEPLSAQRYLLEQSQQ
jgi:polyphosphate kinase